MKLIKAVPPKVGDTTITFFSKRKVYVINFSHLSDAEISVINTIINLPHRIIYIRRRGLRDSIKFNVTAEVLMVPYTIELPIFCVEKYQPHEYFEELL